MKPRVGQTLASVVDGTTVVVVRWPGEDLEVTCGGVVMVDKKDPRVGTGEVDAAHAEGTALGKRYTDEERGVELLCTKAGKGTLALEGVPMPLKAAKPLPASD
ncbi:hypothetical protein GIY30_19010 [Gordonia sp. HNM0687]|uniref:Uncharacterized protein n=1 Tax=Gordonia mangrovi TaxID=2665643 RepID=A0A6L7GV26_9ACTN|nr:hypothetical protein [Gordonia mangrovi]MXP23433.1 hypothetical protein [Gordonia mangrovi]UVF76671.1 hypothetical protein NWF22_14995 [Gordonia mangrovi]